MMRNSSRLTKKHGRQSGGTWKERRRSWNTGSMLIRTLGPEDRCQREILRDDLSIGVCFQSAGSEVNWRLEGKLALDKTWSSNTGSHDMIIFPPGCDFQCSCRGSGEGLWLFIDPQSITDDDRVKSFSQRATVDNTWTKDRLCWAIASELRRESANAFPRGPMFLESAAITFLTQLAYTLTGGEPRAEPVRALREPKLRMILEHFEAHLDRNITLSELAGLVGLTPRYFCGAFKEATGRPPHQFQIEMRIERAKMLLLDGDLPLIDIALAVGFNSQSHFNEYFRRMVGLTPARFRAEARQSKMTATGGRQLS